MRAYLRVDPNLADKKAGYPDGAFRAFVECMCFSEQQPVRGYFRNERLLRVLLERRGRWIPYLIDHGDIIREPDGRLYLEGWLEWQEGDHTVSDRMTRLRNRKRNGSDPPDMSPTVTDPSAVGGKRLADSGGGPPSRGPTFMNYRPKAIASPEAVRAQHEDAFQVCGKCGQRKGGPAHGPNRDHDFEVAA